VDREGFAPMFQFAALIGLVAVVFCLIEWVRLTLERRKVERLQAKSSKAL
jgi:PAT family beta-lactamase induction signal transducer AmpG